MLGEILSNTEAIITIVFALFGAGWGIVMWFSRRQKARDKALSNQVSNVQTDAISRITHVENRVQRLEGDMHKGFAEVDDRLGAVERSLETVARKGDIDELKISQARMDARLGGMVESDKALAQQMQNQGGNISDIMKILVGKGHSA